MFLQNARRPSKTPQAQSAPAAPDTHQRLDICPETSQEMAVGTDLNLTTVPPPRGKAQWVLLQACSLLSPKVQCPTGFSQESTMKYSLYLLSWVSTEQAVGCSVKHRKAHTVPSSTTLMPGSGCCGTAWPWPPHLPPAAAEKGSLLRRGAGEAAPTSRCPEDQVFCSAANQNCPLANPPQTLSPRPSPQLSCRAHGGRRQSSLLIYFRLVSLGRLHEKPLGVAVLGSPGAMLWAA